MTMSKPDLPATKKQLWLLHLLTKEDTRNWNLTVKQASEKISELKGSNGKVNRKNNKPDTQTKLDKKWHYCVMYGYAPPDHHWSNGLWRWKACYTTKDKRQALKLYNEYLQKNTGREYALVYCTAVLFARRLLQIRKLEGNKFCKILETTITNERG